MTSPRCAECIDEQNNNKLIYKNYSTAVEALTERCCSRAKCLTLDFRESFSGLCNTAVRNVVF